MKYNKIIIDLFNIYAKHYYIKSSLLKLTGKELYTQVIIGVIQSINKVEREHLEVNGKIIILSDNPTSKENLRTMLSSKYKKNREKKPDEYYKYTGVLTSILLAYKDNFIVSYIEGVEADDILLPCIENIPENESILLFSEDRDWAKMIEYKNRQIHWFRKDKDIIFDKEKYKEQYHYIPTLSSVTIEKTFNGDRIDNIDIPVKGLLKKHILKMAEEFNSVYDLLAKIDSLDYLGNWKDKIKENKNDIITNYQLVDFIKIEKEEYLANIYICKYQPSKLEVYYKSLNIPFSFDERIAYSKFENKGFKFGEKIPRASLTTTIEQGFNFTKNG